MTAVIALLRGVNVGGHNKIKMEVLRALLESLGLKNVQTLIQSGNAVFATKPRDLDQLAKRIEAAIEKTAGFHSEVILRTAGEVRDVIAGNPFAGRKDVEFNKLHVNFRADAAPIGAVKTAGEEIHADGRHLYVYYPNGAGQSKLRLPGTARNWNTVLKLAEMASAAEK